MAKKKTVLVLPPDERIGAQMTLMLPPLPGTDTAHPAFEVDEHNVAWMFVYREGELIAAVMVSRGGVICPVAAAAIAHYWHAHGVILKESCPKFFYGEKVDLIIKNSHCWSSISAGSRDFDGAEIEGYTCKP